MRKKLSQVVIRISVGFSLFSAQFFYPILPVLAIEDLPSSLVVTNSASWVPYSFIDSRQQPNGLLIDLWRLFGEKNNVEIKFKLVNWSDSLELVRQGKADIHGGLTLSETRENFLQFSSPIIRVKTLLFSTVESVVTDISAIGNRVVGVVAASYEEEFINTHFPDTVLRAYANSEQMVRAAVDGDIEAFVADHPTGYYRLIVMDALDRFEEKDILFVEAISVAVNRDSEGLIDFINAGFEAITEQEKAAIRSRWFIPEESIPKWIMPTITASAVLGLLVMLGGHYITLQRTVRRKTEALNVSIAELQTANAKLNRLARIDSLTGLANRHHFYELATREIQRVKRYSGPLSLAVFDLDHFKGINDRYGHLAGDAALKKVAETVLVKLRENDVFARLGGDEFAALLLETNREEAMQLAERLIKEVGDTRLEYQGQVIALSCSAGVAKYKGEDSVDQWIKHADDELYRSKTSGRAQVSG
jgi:diguanylate cyclase (GGDEF)-like protein